MSDIQVSGNTVRVTNQRNQRVYITYVLRILQGGPDKNGQEQTKYNSVTISAMGRAIHHAVNVAEIVKRRIVGLHQITTISSEVVDASNKDAQTDGDDKGPRKASVITIQLSRDRLNTKDVGYQAPLPESMITEEQARPPRLNNDERRPRSARGGQPRSNVREGGRPMQGGYEPRDRVGGQSSRGGNTHSHSRGGRGGNPHSRGGRGSY